MKINSMHSLNYINHSIIAFANAESIIDWVMNWAHAGSEWNGWMEWTSPPTAALHFIPLVSLRSITFHCAKAIPSIIQSNIHSRKEWMIWWWLKRMDWVLAVAQIKQSIYFSLFTHFTSVQFVSEINVVWIAFNKTKNGIDWKEEE